MKVEVRYFSRSGNTKKLAEAIAKEVGVEAKSIGTPLTDDVDILFLGSSVYAFEIDENVKKFINNIDVKIGKVVNFSTAAVVKSTYKQVEKLLNEKHIPMAKDEFYCKGSFGPLHKGRPNEKDLQNVATFAQNIIKNK